MLHAYSIRKKLIATAICLIVFTCLITPLTHAQKLAEITKPNIIFILADDVGYSVPPVNGGQSYATPNIDSMARSGMNFKHCQTSGMCSPSRFLFLTGKYNFRNYSNWGYMNEKEKTIANVMHDAGYVTGILGKLQLTYKYTTMRNWGWDHHVVFELTEDTMAYRRYKSPVLMEDGYRIPDSVTANKYCDDILTQKLFKFIDSNKTKPFFAYYSMSIGHVPFSPTPDDAAFAAWDPKSGKSDTSFFSSMMRYMDKKVGLILRWLHTKGLDKNTIVFFSGDNGIPYDIYYNANGVNHVRGGKGLPTEAGTHVPLITYWPGHIQKGSSNDDLIDFIDLLPTFAEAAQVTDLSKYGKLDGRSFYRALLQQPRTTNQQLFSHYNQHPGFTKLQRWVRDKVYKLYDSTGNPRAGNFYNIVNDKWENHPIKDSDLTAAEKQIKQRFKNILDTIGTWPKAPGIENPLSENITNTSARLTATIIREGASKLIDRGSTVVKSAPEVIGPFLKFGRMHDTTVKSGTFSQVRTGLLPQTLYQYSLYAMNNNKSNSTSFAIDSFYTLSNPVLLQPASFTSSINSGIVYLNWGNAKFPSTGAKNAGYLLVYSKDSIKILQNPNGKPPGNVVVNGQMIPTASTVLPHMPAVSATIPGLLPGTYKFKLIPYTWNGSKTATYNYLTKNALTITVTIQSFAFNNSAATTSGEIELPVSLEKPVLYPSPSTGNISITYDHSSTGKMRIKVFDISGKIVFTNTALAIKGNNIYNLDLSNLKPGVYYLELTDANEQNRMKFIIQK